MNFCCFKPRSFWYFVWQLEKDICAGYFYILIMILHLCSGMMLNYLETVWPIWIFLLSFSKTVKSSIMVAGPITSWQTDGEKVEIVTDFIFLDSKSTADGARRHKIKRHLVLGREAITNLNRVLESRAITLVTKVHVVKALVFPIIMCRCESQSIKKAESRRTDPFALRYTVFQGSKDKPNSSLIKPGTTSL